MWDSFTTTILEPFRLPFRDYKTVSKNRENQSGPVLPVHWKLAWLEFKKIKQKIRKLSGKLENQPVTVENVEFEN
jgi:hypothetical protein